MTPSGIDGDLVGPIDVERALGDSNPERLELARDGAHDPARDPAREPTREPARELVSGTDGDVSDNRESFTFVQRPLELLACPVE